MALPTFRPEIISIVDYKPVYVGQGRELTGVGKLIDVSYQARMLREETLQNIINDMDKAPQTKSQLSSMAQSFKKSVGFYKENH
jgi:hypothetical protein